MRAIFPFGMLLSFIAVAPSLASSSQHQWCSSAIQTGGAEVVTLGGVLDQKTVWGPPNFGENPKTDSHVTVWFLHLDYPVPVALNKEVNRKPSAKATPVRVKEIQLNVVRSQLDQMQLHLGFHTVITGTLWTAIAPTDLTPATMNVTDIAPLGAPAPTCKGRKRKQAI